MAKREHVHRDGHFLDQLAFTLGIIKQLIISINVYFAFHANWLPPPPPRPTQTPCPLSVVTNDLANQGTYWPFRSASILFPKKSDLMRAGKF